MPHKITQTIYDLFEQHGHQEYGEGITQSSHAVQAALLAQAAGYDNELILAAWLHDIGHLLPLATETHYKTMGEYGVEAHDKIGEDFLAQYNFGERLIAAVRNHVDAKRYLCFAEENYHKALSIASQQTLAYQGGPMTATEAKKFAESPYFQESIALRRLDEAAKETNFEIQAKHWKYLTSLFDEYLSKS